MVAASTSNEKSCASQPSHAARETLIIAGRLGSPEFTLSWLAVVRRTRLSASCPLQAHGSAVEQLPLCSRVVGISLVRVWVDVAAVAVVAVNRRRHSMRRRSPADTAHVGATSSASRSLPVLDARLQCSWRRSVGRGVRRRTDVAGETCRGRGGGVPSVQVVAQVGRQGGVSHISVLHSVGTHHLSARRHRHGPLCRRRRRDR